MTTNLFREFWPCAEIGKLEPRQRNLDHQKLIKIVKLTIFWKKMFQMILKMDNNRKWRPFNRFKVQKNSTLIIVEEQIKIDKKKFIQKMFYHGLTKEDFIIEISKIFGRIIEIQRNQTNNLLIRHRQILVLQMIYKQPN